MYDMKLVLEVVGVAFASVFVLFVIYAKFAEISNKKDK